MCFVPPVPVVTHEMVPFIVERTVPNTVALNTPRVFFCHFLYVCVLSALSVFTQIGGLDTIATQGTWLLGSTQDQAPFPTVSAHQNRLPRSDPDTEVPAGLILAVSRVSVVHFER